MSLRVFGPAQATWEAGGELVLDRQESHYLCKVRRARQRARIDVFDGQGGIWQAEVVKLDARATTLRLDAPLTCQQPAREVTLILGAPAGPALLDALTRASEAGASTIAIVHMQRSQAGRPKDERIARVLLAAQRQCGRPLPPRIVWPASLEACTQPHADSWDLFAWTGERAAVSKPTGKTGPARLVIGPEGGLHSTEVELLRAHGFAPVGLGPWVQRTETAVATGLARVLLTE